MKAYINYLVIVLFLGIAAMWYISYKNAKKKENYENIILQKLDSSKMEVLNAQKTIKDLQSSIKQYSKSIDSINLKFLKAVGK